MPESVKFESSLRIDADLSCLARMRDFVRASASVLGLDRKETYDVELAVDEAITNIILHGYGNQGGTIGLAARVENDALVIRLRDRTKPFDPTWALPNDLSRPPQERPAGGMGLYLMRKGMDQLTHRVTETGENELTMIKRRGSGIHSGLVP
jgi:serine/threonine-protein kinase RsbW